MFFNNKNNTKKVFLDFASSTPIDEGVLDNMESYNRKYFANPSALYSEALASKEELDIAKRDCAGLMSCNPDEIVFTSGGTESNNLAILGLFETFKKEDFKPHIITTNIEHPSVLEVCKEIERRGGEVTYLEVSEEGLVSVDDVSKAIKKETILVSVMYANNEIGTIQPIKEISKVIKKWQNEEKTSLPYFHTDACQAVLYLSTEVSKIGVDMMTLDGLKMYGPRNTGILFVKKGIKLHPVIYGGGQQNGLRSGTEDISSISGMAFALEMANMYREEESKRLSLIRDYAIENILKTFEGSSLNGSAKDRLPNNINICFKDQDAEFLVIALDVVGISVSYSSSCRTLKEDSSSYVISALGKKECSSSSLRITLGRGTKKDDLDYLVEKLKEIIK